MKKIVLVMWDGIEGDAYVDGQHVAAEMNGADTMAWVRKYNLIDRGMIRLHLGQPFREYRGEVEG